MTSLKYTSADLEFLPDSETTRYEIVDGELLVSKAPKWGHQYACLRVLSPLDTWSQQTRAGVAMMAPGLIFVSDQDVIPDLVWIRHDRLAGALDSGGHLRIAPDLVVEVLSPGAENARRDRELKLRLYSRQGVREYWIVDWAHKAVQVYRRVDAALQLIATFRDDDILSSPMLPGFSCPIDTLWAPEYEPWQPAPEDAE